MSDEKHTELPWQISNRAYADSQTDGNIVIRSQSGIVAMACTIHEGLINAEENAAFIARACNSHKALLETCRNFFEWHANHFEDFDDEVNGQLLCLSNEAEAAIGLAEKEA